MRLVLAPMEGVIDHTMRDLLTAQGGLDRCVTEFLRVSDRLLPPRVFRRLCPELDAGGTTPAGVPVYLQLLGGQPSPMADNAARAAELGAPGIDLNFGCPAKTVNRSDGGAILLREPERVGSIVAAVRRAVAQDTPVTVKIRLGYDDQGRYYDNVHAIAEAGADELTIHARTRRQGYRPPAHWDQIARARQWLSIPVIANGEIWGVEDARRCQAVTGCLDLMLGRGALCRPDLPRLVRAALAGAATTPLSWLDITRLLLDFLGRTRRRYDRQCVGNPLKQWLVYLRTYYPQAGRLFESIKRLREAEELQRRLWQEHLRALPVPATGTEPSGALMQG